MYIFAEPVTDEQMEDLQNRNSAKIEAFERDILGLPPKDAEETAEEKDDGWEDIQAKVEEAMESDERGDENVAENGEIAATDSNDQHASASAEDGEEDNEDDSGDEEENGEESEEESEEVESEEEGEEGVLTETTEASQENLEGEVSTGGEPEESQDEELFEPIEEVKVEEVIEEESETDALNEGLSAKNEDEVQETEQEFEEDEAEEVHEEDRETNDTQETQEEEPETIHSPKPNDQPQAPPKMTMADIAQSLKSALMNSTTTSTADSVFLNQIDDESPSSTSPKPPLLAMTLTIRNKVDGRYILRPVNITTPPPSLDSTDDSLDQTSESSSNLHPFSKSLLQPLPPKEPEPSAKWTVEYTLTDVTNHDRAWTLYEACQQRRKKMLDRDEESEEEREGQSYFRLMRELSEKGRVWRKEVERREGGLEKMVLGREREG
jgi:hypothetical protein